MVDLLIFAGLGIFVGLLARTRIEVLALLAPLAMFAWYYEYTAAQEADVIFVNRIVAFNFFYLLGLIYRLKAAREPLRRPHHALVLMFIALYLGSYFYARGYGIGFRSFAVQACFILTGTAAGLACRATSIRSTLFLIVAISMVSIAGSFYYGGTLSPYAKVGLEYSPLAMGWGEGERRYGLLPSITFDGALLGIGLAASLITGLRDRRIRILQLARLASLVLFVGVYLVVSQFRVILFSILVVGLAWFVVVARSRTSVWLSALCGVLLIAILFSDVQRILSAPFLGRQSLATADIRVDMNRESLKIFLDSPLFGHGILTNGPIFTERAQLGTFAWDIQGSHSAHMIVLTELGLVGFIIWALMYMLTLKTGYRGSFLRSDIYPEKGVNVAVFFSVIAFVFAQFFHGMIYDPLIWMLIAWRYPPIGSSRLG